MNGAYVHLLFNDLPLILNAAAVVVLLLSFVWRSAPTARAAIVLALLAALSGIPTFYSGDYAEHLVEEMDGINEVAIHPHEDAAEWAFGFLLAEGAITLLLLIAFRKRDLPKWALALLVVAVIGSMATTARTAFLGGKIHHPETEMRTAD